MFLMALKCAPSVYSKSDAARFVDNCFVDGQPMQFNQCRMSLHRTVAELCAHSENVVTHLIIRTSSICVFVSGWQYQSVTNDNHPKLKFHSSVADA